MGAQNCILSYMQYKFAFLFYCSLPHNCNKTSRRSGLC